VITLIFLFVGVVVLAIIGAGVYLGRTKRSKAAVAQSSPHKASRATGPGDD
jgi:hypothetical protein